MSVENSGTPATSVPAPAPTTSTTNPHPAAVQPAPAGAPLTVNYNVAAPAGQSAPAAAPAPAGIPPASQHVTIPLEQLQAFTSIQARLAQMEADQRARDEAHQREQTSLLLAKGQAEEAVRMLREQSDKSLQDERNRTAEIQRQAQGYAMDVEVARAMAGHIFVSPVARNTFEAEVRRELLAEPHGSSFVVRTPTFQTAEQLVNAKLAHADYQFLLAPKGNPGGGTANGQSPQAGPTPPSQPTPAAPPPNNLGQAIVAAAISGEIPRGVVSPPDVAARNMAVGFGLRRIADRSAI